MPPITNNETDPSSHTGSCNINIGTSYGSISMTDGSSSSAVVVDIEDPHLQHASMTSSADSGSPCIINVGSNILERLMHDVQDPEKSRGKLILNNSLII